MLQLGQGGFEGSVGIVGEWRASHLARRVGRVQVARRGRASGEEASES